jgi:hypothetical protein
MKKVHTWAAIGRVFKSDLVFYDVGNTNGKMTQRGYIDQILEPVVKPWLEHGDHFVLEEDGDSGHGPGKSNIVRKWKEIHHLTHYFNCHSALTLHLLRTVGNHLNSTLRSSLTGMRVIQGSWHLKDRTRSPKSSLIGGLKQCHKGLRIVLIREDR